MRTQEIVEAYGKTHIYMIGMDDNPQPKHIEVIIKNVGSLYLIGEIEAALSCRNS